MKSEITDVLMTGVSNGESVDDIATSLAGFFDAGSEWKAERLARTETIDAYNQGNLEGYKQSGVVTGKSWLFDEGECKSEQCPDNMSQGVIPIDDDFQSGDDAPPAHPNCECSLQPEVGDLSENV
jgi:SPP1 gp7 family putative phage head morphogenesis protein